MSVNQAIKSIVDSRSLKNKHQNSLITGIVFATLPKKVNAIVYTDYNDDTYIHIHHDRYSAIIVDVIESVIKLYLITPYDNGEGKIYWEGIGLYNNPHIEESIKRFLGKGLSHR